MANPSVTVGTEVVSNPTAFVGIASNPNARVDPVVVDSRNRDIVLCHGGRKAYVAARNQDPHKVAGGS